MEYRPRTLFGFNVLVSTKCNMRELEIKMAGMNLFILAGSCPNDSLKLLRKPKVFAEGGRFTLPDNCIGLKSFNGEEGSRSTWFIEHAIAVIEAGGFAERRLTVN